jgi:putative transposase
MNRALKVRLYPNQNQISQIRNMLGGCRFLYNQMLGERIKVYEKYKDDRQTLFTYKYKTEKQYKEEYEFLKENDSIALQQKRRDLESAYKNFFRSCNNQENVGFPKFKSKHHHRDSYRTLNVADNIKIDFENQKLKLPKLEKISYRCKKPKEWFFTAGIKSVTVQETPSGKYYASILFDGEDINKPVIEKENPKVIGLDMSLQKFYVDSMGNSPEYIKQYKRYQEDLAKAQGNLSRKSKGSKNRAKARIKVARIHERISNCRREFIEKESLNLVKKFDVIVVENLAIREMSQSLNLGKSVMDIGYSAFINRLQMKAEEYGKRVILADRWFASSKTCHVCGYKNKNLLLQERDWICPICKTKLNRDINAAINLENLFNRRNCEASPVNILSGNRNSQESICL